MRADDVGLQRLLGPGVSFSPYFPVYFQAVDPARTQSFAQKHPTIAFTHIAPGVVRTNLTHGQPGDWMLRAFTPLTTVLGYVAGISADDSGEYMWSGIHAGDKGMFRRGQRGEDIGDKKLFTSEDVLEKVWAHTLEETSEKNEQ